MFKDVSGDWRSDSLGATHLTLKETIYPQVNSSINRDIITSLPGRAGRREGSFIKQPPKLPLVPELNDHDSSKPNLSGSEGGDHV